jgi:hypothetical protein
VAHPLTAAEVRKVLPMQAVRTGCSRSLEQREMTLRHLTSRTEAARWFLRGSRSFAPIPEPDSNAVYHCHLARARTPTISKILPMETARCCCWRCRLTDSSNAVTAIAQARFAALSHDTLDILGEAHGCLGVDIERQRERRAARAVKFAQD